MDRTEFIGKLQMCYFGDRNAFEEIVSVYDNLIEENKELHIKLEDRAYEELKIAYKQLKDRIDKAIDLLYCWGDVLNIKFQEEMMKILKED